MVAVGLLIMLAGFLLSLLSLTLASALGVRMVLVLVGLAITLFGLIGVLNRAYLKNPIWKR
jgi:uncharacterized membrane protein YgaE (UPF0421/DUF939 family)